MAVAGSPDGIRQALPSPDSRRLLVRTTDGALGIVTIGESSPPVIIRGLTARDDVIGWTGDGRGIIVAARTIPAQIARVDLATGARTLLREVAPPDLTGVASILVAQWLDDGRGYSYTYLRAVSKLFVATGVRP